MATSDAALVARLEVRLNKFEKQMRDANGIAAKGVKDIEDKFSTANISLGTGIGNFLGKRFDDLVQAGISAIEKMIASLKALNETARITSLSLGDVLTAQLAGKAGGVEDTKINAGLQRLAELMERAKRGEDNDLAKLFSANDIDLSKIENVYQAWRKIADLVQNAADPVQARAVAEMATGSKELEAALRGGSAALDAQRAAAEDLAHKYDDLNRGVKEIGDAWDAVTAKLVTDMKVALNDIFRLIKESGIQQAISDLFSGLKNPTDPRFKTQGTTPRLYDSQGNLLTGGELIPNEGAAPGSSGLPVTAPKPPRGGRRTVLPDLTPKSSSGGTTKDPVDQVTRFLEQQRKVTAEAETQLAYLGKSNESYQVALELARLNEAVERDKTRGVTHTAEEIEKANDKIREEVALREKSKQIVQDTNQLQNFGGNILVDSLMQATEAGAKLSDVMGSVAKQIARAALQALLLGQGPLAGLFGTSGGQSGQVGGGLGALFSLFNKSGGGILDSDFARAKGGPVIAGQPYVVGENGPEIMVPGSPGRVIPNGGGGVSVVQTIDARGAQAGVADQIVAALAANNRALQTSLPAMIRNAQGRGSVR